MDEETRKQVALHRCKVIAEALGHRLTGAERARIEREIAGRTHTHPDGTRRHYSRRSIDRWIRGWREGGHCAFKPDARVDAGGVRAHPELIEEVCRLRLERPDRSAAQIARMIYYHHGICVAERTVRAQLRRRGLRRGEPRGRARQVHEGCEAPRR